MKFVGLLLILTGGLILGACIIAAIATAPEGEVLNLPILIGGFVVSTFFDIGGIVVMKIMPKA